MVLDAAGAVRFDFNVDAHSGPLAFQGFRRHVGVGDTRRAGRDADDEGPVRWSGGGRFISRSRFCFSSFFFRFCRQLGRFRLVDDGQIFVSRLGVHQLFPEFVIHEHAAQAAQHFQVDVGSAGRGSDEEEQEGRLVVQAFIFYTRTDDHRRQPRSGHGVRLGVGDGDAFTDARTAFGFAGQHGLAVSFQIRHVAAFIHQGYEMVDSRALVSGDGLQVDTFFFQ